jgi:hypothetical protein
MTRLAKKLLRQVGRFRCDFLADRTYIEYFGLRGDQDYDIKIELKIALCKRLGLRLVAIYPEDLLQRAVLESKLIPQDVDRGLSFYLNFGSASLVSLLLMQANETLPIWSRSLWSARQLHISA